MVPSEICSHAPRRCLLDRPTNVTVAFGVLVADGVTARRGFGVTARSGATRRPEHSGVTVWCVAFRGNHAELWWTAARRDARLRSAVERPICLRGYVQRRPATDRCGRLDARCSTPDAEVAAYGRATSRVARAGVRSDGYVATDDRRQFDIARAASSPTVECRADSGGHSRIAVDPHG